MRIRPPEFAIKGFGDYDKNSSLTDPHIDLEFQ